MAQLQHPLGPAEVLQTVGAEVGQRHAVGQVVPGQVSGRPEQQDLPAVPDGPQPGARITARPV